MIYQHPKRPSRTGVASVELVMLLPLICVLIMGIWDIGRLIEVQQVLSNAAREGARQAAIGFMLDPTTGTEVDILASDVKTTVLNYLTRNAISNTGVTVTFLNVDQPALLDPYQATNLQHLRVTVQVPLANVRWVLANNFINVSATGITGTADWLSIKDSSVVVPTTLPTN